MILRHRLSATLLALALAGPFLALARCGTTSTIADRASSSHGEPRSARSGPRPAVAGDGYEDPASSKRARGRQSTYANTGTERSKEHGGESPDDDAGSVSFAAARDFATGATPFTDAFNHAAGDQIFVQRAHTAVSDGIALGDFNQDGVLDAAQTNVLAGTVSVFTGDGRGGFSKPTNALVGVNPSFLLARDLDSDGILDLAIADSGANGVFILSGDGRGGFGTAFSQFVAVPSPRDIAIGDVNADGIFDLAVSSHAGAAVLTGSKSHRGVSFGTAQFVKVAPSVPPTLANSVVLGDFDGVRGDDLALGVGSSPSAGDRQAGTDELTGDNVLVYLNQHAPGTGPFADAPSQRIRVGAQPEGFAVTDFDGDSHTDLAVLDAGNGDVATLLGDGAGHFTLKARNTTVGCLPRSVKVADVDRDGIADLVTAQFCASTAAVLIGRGDGTFDPAVDFWVGNSPTAVDVGFINADKRADIVVARLRGDRMSLLLNETPRRGDGVGINRDIAYVEADTDPMAAHRTLDVYAPPAGMPSLAGAGQPYPVLLFAHGGSGVAGDKSTVTYVMRSLAREGVVAISTNYRLKGQPAIAEEAADVAAAFGWTRINIARYGGDPDRIVVGGTSTGAWTALRLSTDVAYSEQQTHIRGLVMLGPTPVPGENDPPASLLIDGTDGVEVALAAGSTAFAAHSQRRGVQSTTVMVPDRDHFSVVATLAVPTDPGRQALLHFLRGVMH